MSTLCPSCIHKNKLDWTRNCHAPAMALSSKWWLDERHHRLQFLHLSQPNGCGWIIFHWHKLARYLKRVIWNTRNILLGGSWLLCLCGKVSRNTSEIKQSMHSSSASGTPTTPAMAPTCSWWSWSIIVIPAKSNYSEWCTCHSVISKEWRHRQGTQAHP